MAKLKNISRGQAPNGSLAPKGDGKSNGSSLLTALTSPLLRPQPAASKPPETSGDLKLQSLSTQSSLASLNFGRFPSSKATTPQTGSQWTNLLSLVSSGGAANVLSGGLGAIGSLASLFSNVISLFGGSSSAPPALVKFALPTSQQLTVSLQSDVHASQNSGQNAQSVSESRNTGGAYNLASVPAATQNGALSEAAHNAQIIQVVKQALLNSSSLNDVIAEI